jgi:hypothetical protein
LCFVCLLATTAHADIRLGRSTVGFCLLHCIVAGSSMASARLHSRFPPVSLSTHTPFEAAPRPAAPLHCTAARLHCWCLVGKTGKAKGESLRDAFRSVTAVVP